MRIGVPCEVLSGECRVAIAPDTIGRLSKLGFTVQVQSGAGEKASFPDRLYVAAGAAIVDTAKEAWDADIVAKINPPMEHPELGGHEADLLPEGRTLISYIWPSSMKLALSAVLVRWRIWRMVRGCRGEVLVTR